MFSHVQQTSLACVLWSRYLWMEITNAVRKFSISFIHCTDFKMYITLLMFTVYFRGTINTCTTEHKQAMFVEHVNIIIPVSSSFTCKKFSNLFVSMFILANDSCVSCRDFGKGGCVLRLFLYIALNVVHIDFEERVMIVMKLVCF
jgi:hypothetical protein